LPVVTQLTSEPSRSADAPTAALPPDWFAALGVMTTFSAPAQPRVGPPHFVYRGSADEHLRGQSCYPDPDSLAHGETRGVIMACGCRLIVPWWTLEPARP